MKQNNVIDFTSYLVQQNPRAETGDGLSIRKVFHAAGRIIDIASTAAIAVCLCACLLLFFTML